MDRALRIKEKREALENEISQIRDKNIETVKEKCRVDVTKKGKIIDFLGRLHNERLQSFQEENIIRAREASELYPKQIEQTQRLAEGVLRLKNKEIWEQKNRQVLRDRNIELKELDSQLKSTYAAKAARVQLKERESNKSYDKYLEKEESLIRGLWYNDDKFDEKLRRDKIEKTIKYRNDIQDQMINDEIIRQQLDEEKHRERKIIEEVSGILDTENSKVNQEKRDKILREKNERDGFLKAKYIWKCKEREAILEEFNRREKYIEDKMIQENEEAANKSAKSLAKNLTMDKHFRKMLDDEVKRNEREDIINELIVEELDNEVIQTAKNNAIKKEITKKELLDDMERQKRFIADKKNRDAAVDDAFAKYLAEQFEEVLKKENQKYERRRSQGIRYGNDLKIVCDEERLSYAKELLARKYLRNYDEKFELKRLEEVALERSKILYEHVPKLNGFLKAGTLRPEDYENMKMMECNGE